jgi:manganese oxidase
MKAYMILIGCCAVCALYGQMNSSHSITDHSNSPIEHRQKMDHSHAQEMDHSMPHNSIQNQADSQQKKKNKQNIQNKRKGTKTAPKGILKCPSVITPNVGSLPWTMDGNVKVFHLVAEPIRREFAPGFWVNCWGYNGSSPGPTIEAVEGDRVRIFVTNKLNEPTSIHWHGIILPNGMDGVSGLTQKAILPGETFKYEFTLKQNGTFMYHPHTDEMFQIAMGMEGFFIIHPKDGDDPPIDRDFAIFLHEWRIPMGAKTPVPFEMLDFNIFTFNSVLYPNIESLVAKIGDRVRIRFGNAMMNTHPIHLHGHEFLVTRRGGKRLPPIAQYSEVTVLVAPGETRDIEFIADNPGDWALHCHKSHHTMNQMQHDLPNLVGIQKQGIEERIRQFFPNFMGLMNINGMSDMFEMYGTNTKMDMGIKLKYPSNISPIGSPGPFGVMEMGGMFTILKIRNHLTSYADPGWYQHPSGTVAEAVNIHEFTSNRISYSIHHRSDQSPHDMSKVSWFSQEEDKKELHAQEGTNWMQSKPEDSMMGHMTHSSDMKAMPHDMQTMSHENMMDMSGHHMHNMNQMEQTSNRMQHMEH